MDSIVVLGNNPIAQNALTAIIPNVQLTDKTSLKWQDFVKNCEGLKKRHNRPNLVNYHFKEDTSKEAFQALNQLTSVITSGDNLLKDFFTINYDRVLEEFFDISNTRYIDGFIQTGKRNLWSPTILEKKRK